MLEAQAADERERLADLSKEVEKVEELKAVVEETKAENLEISSRLEQEKKLHSQAAEKLLELDAIAEQLGDLQGAKEREERAREEVSKLVEQLKEKEVRGREEGEKWGDQVNSLEAELRSLSEQLEESGRDMSEKISQVTHLEEKLAEALAREEEAKAHREEVRAREEDGMLEQVEALASRVEGLQEEVNRRREEAAEVGVARQLLLEQLDEREEDRRGAVARLAEAEQRITALQVGREDLYLSLIICMKFCKWCDEITLGKQMLEVPYSIRLFLGGVVQCESCRLKAACPSRPDSWKQTRHYRRSAPAT